jgi:cysteine desulfurase
MSEDRVYLDHNATTPVRPEAARAMAQALLRGGNPSSVHAEGRRARSTVEDARERIAAFVGGRAKNVTFTSGATEALNLALTPSLRAGVDARPWHLLMGATEHAAVLAGHRFPAEDVALAPVNGDGLVDLTALVALMDRNPERRPLVALQMANNETGAIQPVRAAADLVHDRGGVLVCDAVQAAGRIAVDIEALGADVLVLSAHKIGGAPGAGALIRASEALHVGDPLVRGGGQEKGWRGGTENVPAIAAFAAAVEASGRDLEVETSRLVALRDRLENGIRALDARTTIFAGGVERLPNTLAFAFPGIPAETALIALDLAGIAVSSGSACSSGKVKSSHVLDAMGTASDIRGSMLRASFGWTSRDGDVDLLLAALAKLHGKFSSAGKVLAA